MKKAQPSESQSKDIDIEIEHLTQLLTELDVRQAEIDRQRRKTRESINSLIIERRKKETERAGKVDRNESVIEVGDKVIFLTRGKYKSKGGKVTKVDNNRFITVEDSEGRKINRDPYNVKICKKVRVKNDSRRRSK